MIRHAALSATVCAALLTPTLAAAQATPDARAGRYLAANCASCHGTAGVATSTMPRLAGMPKDIFIKSMAEFRDGKRSATIMHQLAKGYSDEQIALMAAFFASQSAK